MTKIIPADKRVFGMPIIISTMVVLVFIVIMVVVTSTTVVPIVSLAPG